LYGPWWLALVEVYNRGGVGALYGGGAARTLRLCGAFFIINNIRELAIQYKTKMETSA